MLGADLTIDPIRRPGQADGREHLQHSGDRPAGEGLDLATEEGSWLPGFERIGYPSGKVAFYWPEEYGFAVARSPGVFDMAWHGGESSPMLVMDYAKAIISAGEGGEKT